MEWSWDGSDGGFWEILNIKYQINIIRTHYMDWGIEYRVGLENNCRGFEECLGWGKKVRKVL